MTILVGDCVEIRRLEAEIKRLRKALRRIAEPQIGAEGTPVIYSAHTAQSIAREALRGDK